MGAATKVIKTVNFHFLSCHKCGETTIIQTARAKAMDGFIKHGCTHSVARLLLEMLKDRINARKKKTKRKA